MQGRRGGRGAFRRGGSRGGGRGGRGGGGRAASSGNPSTYKPTVPHKLGKELGLGGGGSGGRPRPADGDDDDGAAGDNAFGGSTGAYAMQGRKAEDNDEEHAGPGKACASAHELIIASPGCLWGHCAAQFTVVISLAFWASLNL